jgi:hypothetical protein
MNGTFRIAVVALVAATFSPPAPVFAKTDFGVAAFGGYESYSMSDLNDVIGVVNLALAGTGYVMGDIDDGFGYGGGVRIMPSEKFLISLDYMRLPASSEVSAFGSSLKINVPGNGWTGTLTYFLSSTSKTKLGIAGGMGYYTGSATADTSGASTGAKLSGNGIGFQGFGVLDATLSPTVHAEVAAGYRYAKTGGVEDETGASIQNFDGEDFTLDWSGFMSRVGLAFYFGKK